MSALRFQRDLNRFVRLCEARLQLLHERAGAHVGRSIRYGSPITGAPGQPVKSGALLESWHEQRAGPYDIRWVSYKPYARIIEDNLRGAQLRSSVGGFHSVKMTRAGWKAIVAYELNIVKAAIPDGSTVFRDTVGNWHGAGGRFISRPGG